MCALQENWTKALASWTCPTNPVNSVGSACDPCGQQVCRARCSPACARCLSV